MYTDFDKEDSVDTAFRGFWHMEEYENDWWMDNLYDCDYENSMSLDYEELEALEMLYQEDDYYDE